MNEQKELDVMAQIQAEKEKEISAQGQQALNPEGVKMADEKRFTFDVVETPIDPLR